MDENLNKLEQFFKQDMEVKTIISDAMPKQETAYSEEYLSSYFEYLYKSLDVLEYNFMKILDNYGFGSENISYVSNLFEEYKRRLDNSGFNFNKLSRFYTECFSDMNEQLVDEVRKNYIGYNGFYKEKNLLQKSKTVNELLHVVHQYIVNDEKMYKSLPKIFEKSNDKGYPISLYGANSELGQEIYEKIPNDLDIGWTDIISLNKSNQILMMIRDRGHALMIEIDYSDEDNLVRYFIPKICSEEMTKKLRGVRKEIIEKGYTTGVFQTKRESTAEEIINFIEKVPTDMDMIREWQQKTKAEESKIELEKMLTSPDKNSEMNINLKIN